MDMYINVPQLVCYK